MRKFRHELKAPAWMPEEREAEALTALERWRDEEIERLARYGLQPNSRLRKLFLRLRTERKLLNLRQRRQQQQDTTRQQQLNHMAVLVERIDREWLSTPEAEETRQERARLVLMP